jgi:hypothetical protein
MDAADSPLNRSVRSSVPFSAFSVLSLFEDLRKNLNTESTEKTGFTGKTRGTAPSKVIFS